MGDTLHKMQVIIEATTSPLKKEMENSRREVKKSVEEIQKETEKVKNPFKGMESKALQPVRNTLNKIREMLSRNPVKNFQIKAGIKVPTEEYAELQKNLSKAQQSLEKLQEKQHKFENTGKSKENQQWKSLVVDITRAEKKLSEYKDAAAKMETSGTAFKQTPTDEYREIRNSVKSLNEEIEKYEKKGEKLEAMGVKKESKQWRSLIYDIEQARGKLFEYEEKMKSLEKSGKSTQQVPTEEYQKIQKDILKVNKELDAYREKKNKLQALGVSKESQEWKSLTYDIDQAKIAVEEYKTKARQMESSNTDVKRPVSLPKQALNFGTGIFKGIGATVSKGWGGFTKLLGGVGNVASSFTGVIRKCSGAYAALIQKFTSGIPFLNRTKSSFNGLGTSGRGLTGILKTIGMTAKFMFASFVIRGAVDGAKQGFQNLAQYSGETNRSLSLLMSSLTQLKNSLATAFAPILNVVAPILNSFIQTVINVVNSIGQLMGALTGKTTMVTAKKVNQDYAASLNSTSNNVRIHSVPGNGNTNMYVKFATLTILSNYINTPMTFKLVSRGWETSNVQILFKSINDPDPGLDWFRADGTVPLWIKKSGTSKWDLYMQKNEPWGSCIIYNFVMSDRHADVTWTTDQVAAIPNGAVKVALLSADANAISRISAAETEISNNKKQIALKASQTEVTNLKGALGDLSVYTNKKTTMVQDITGWQYTWDTVISTDAAEIASHKDYITFDKGNIILGDSASASKLKLTKDSIQFKGTSDTAITPDSDATAWITGKVFHINSGEIESSLKFGNILMKPTKNGIQIGNKAEFGERVRIGYPLSSNMQYTYSDCPLVVGSNTNTIGDYPWFAVDDGYAFVRNGIITPGDFIIKFGEYTLDRPNGGKFSGTLRPYYRADDVINMEFYVNGYVTSNKQEVIFLIPLSRPIMSTPVSISSINGLTIRQNGKYIYGSTASKPIKPSSYTATVIGGRNGLNVRAKIVMGSNEGFTDNEISKIVNNDTCAITASIKISFD